MLWLKAFHIIGVVMWFAGLFYLPRLYVYHVDAQDPAGTERFKIMERRLFTMMTIGATWAAVFGIAMIFVIPEYLRLGWLHAKFTLVAGLLAYHVWCYRLLVAFRDNRNRHSARWYRLFNEVPTLFLITIVVLAVVKPF
jgi:protoporphyrinogen IX oxidase